MADETSISILQWAINGLTAICVTAIGHAFSRVAGVEKQLEGVDQALRTRLSAVETTARSEREQANREMWVAFEAERRSSTEFRESLLAKMVTKDDLKQVEDRLTRALLK